MIFPLQRKDKILFHCLAAKKNLWEGMSSVSQYRWLITNAGEYKVGKITYFLLIDQIKIMHSSLTYHRTTGSFLKMLNVSGPRHRHHHHHHRPYWFIKTMMSLFRQNHMPEQNPNELNTWSFWYCHLPPHFPPLNLPKKPIFSLVEVNCWVVGSRHIDEWEICFHVRTCRIENLTWKTTDRSMWKLHCTSFRAYNFLLVIESNHRLAQWKLAWVYI